MMINFRHGELVETTKEYVYRDPVIERQKPVKKKFGIIIEPKIEMVSGEDRYGIADDFAALVQWADNSEEKVFHYEIEKVVK